MKTPPLLTRLFEILCRHDFSWPHTGAHGQDYQVCLVCGAVYEFDCAAMRRTRRLAEVPGVPPASPRHSTSAWIGGQRLRLLGGAALQHCDK